MGAWSLQLCAFGRNISSSEESLCAFRGAVAFKKEHAERETAIYRCLLCFAGSLASRHEFFTGFSNNIKRAESGVCEGTLGMVCLGGIIRL